MYEGIISSLVRLFAIITIFRDKESLKESNSLVKEYLAENLNKEFVAKYMQMYSELVDYYNAKQEKFWNKTSEGLRSTSDSFNKICDEINASYDLETRFLIVFQLLNFIHRNSATTSNEKKAVDQIAYGFKISTEEYQNLKAFAFGKLQDVPDKSALLVVTGKTDFSMKGIKHLYSDNQSIEVNVLRIASTNTLIYKYKGSRNLYMNGNKVAQNRIYLFPQGASLKTSRINPIYYGQVMAVFIQQKGEHKIVYTADNISYKFSRNTYGLHPFDLIEESGNLVGIIGGSGVGKSTLLNALCGNLKLNTGSVKINGYELNKDKEKLKGIFGYVPQEDLLIEELTVYQNLLYNARLCFSDMNEEEIEAKIEETLKIFELIEARNLTVGTPLKKILSGGQRKRLNLALEFMREPSILMVDEPISGLSSADSEKVMFLLKKQCLKGKLVFANIHQPSSDIFKILDRLIIMDKNGRVVYNGNPMDAITYFKNEARYINPDESECVTCGNVKTEQPLLILESRVVDPFGNAVRKRKMSPQEWYESYQKKIGKNIKAQLAAIKPTLGKLPDYNFIIPKRFRQFRIFAERDIATKLVNHQYLLIALLEAPLLALVLSFFTKYQSGSTYSFSDNVNIVSFLFMSVVVSLFIGLTISAEELFKDRRILKREKFLNLSRGAYLSSKITILFLLSAFQMLVFVLVGDYILEIEGLSFSMWVILFSTACFANVLGLNLSAGLNSAVTIYILVPLLIIPQLLFSGVIVDFNKMHTSIANIDRTPIIGNVMASRWSYEALAVDIYANNEYRKQIFEEEFEKNTFSFKSFYLIPELKNHLSIIQQASSIQREDVVVDKLKTLENEIPNLATEPLSIEILNAMDHIRSMNGTDNDFQNVLNFLNQRQDIYRQSYARATTRLDNKQETLLKSIGKENYTAFKNKYNNSKLEDILKGKYEPIKTKELNHRIYQIDYPIYREPAYSNGGAHFYAPFKILYGIKIPTVLFNVLVIWLMIVILLFTLYFNILKKGITYFENHKLLRLSMLREKIFNSHSHLKEGVGSEL